MADETLAPVDETKTEDTTTDAPALDGAPEQSADAGLTEMPVNDEQVDAPEGDAAGHIDAGEAEAAVPTEGDEASTLPLDASQPSDASPASEETGDQGDATAPEADEAVNPADIAPVFDAPKADEASKADEAPKADGDKKENIGVAREAVGTDTTQEGEDGIGATHSGTDTPAKMISNPCDPVTGKPLNGAAAQAGTGYAQSGDVPAKSETGHAVPGDGLELKGSDEGDKGEAAGQTQGGKADCGHNDVDFADLDLKLDAVQDAFSQLRDALHKAH